MTASQSWAVVCEAGPWEPVPLLQPMLLQRAEEQRGKTGNLLGGGILPARGDKQVPSMFGSLEENAE